MSGRFQKIVHMNPTSESCLIQAKRPLLALVEPNDCELQIQQAMFGILLAVVEQTGLRVVR